MPPAGITRFNRGQGGGFVIVAADDMARNMVLGYADSGTFDADSMPAAMRWWLGEYGQSWPMPQLLATARG